jgi:hypothetical protein
MRLIHPSEPFRGAPCDVIGCGGTARWAINGWVLCNVHWAPCGRWPGCECQPGICEYWDANGLVKEDRS